MNFINFSSLNKPISHKPPALFLEMNWKLNSLWESAWDCSQADLQCLWDSGISDRWTFSVCDSAQSVFFRFANDWSILKSSMTVSTCLLLCLLRILEDSRVLLVFACLAVLGFWLLLYLLVSSSCQFHLLLSYKIISWRIASISLACIKYLWGIVDW